MKKTFVILAALALSSFAYAHPPVEEVVLKSFAKVFPAAEKTSWHENEAGYEAYFENGEIKCRVRFDRQGKILSTLRYYGGEQLSPFLKSKLDSRFAGKKIFGVTEFNSDSELSYQIILEDEKNWIHVQADATGQLQVTEKFRKA